jgi:hypothetical protein
MPGLEPGARCLAGFHAGLNLQQKCSGSMLHQVLLSAVEYFV